MRINLSAEFSLLKRGIICFLSNYLMKMKQVVDRLMLNVLLSVLLLSTYGCSAPRTEVTRFASFRPYRSHNIEGTNACTFLSSRVAMAVYGDNLPTNRSFTIEPGNELHLKGYCATAIDHRGYFLTMGLPAASNDLFILFNSSKYMTAEKARVVWKGNYSKGDPELMILHVERQLDHVFEWATNITAREKVLAVGVSRRKKNMMSPVCMAGKVLDFNPVKNNEAHLKIIHDAPLNSYDFGGPLVTKDGRLLGINYQGAIRYYLIPSWKFLCYAVHPDRKWLLDVIEKDSFPTRSSKTDVKGP